MRFAFLTLGYHPDLLGGAFRYATELAERLAARGHTVEVFSPNPGNALPWQESRAGVSLRRFPNVHGLFALNWRRENARARVLLAEALQGAKGPVLVGCHHAFFAPCLAGPTQPSVFIFHGPWHLEFLMGRASRYSNRLVLLADRLIARVLRSVEQRAFQRVGCLLAVSQYSAQQLAAWYGRPPPAVRVISGGMNPEVFRPTADRQALRRRLGLNEADYLFLAVRRLEPRMGLVTLLDAFALAAKGFPAARLWLAGGGAQREELEARLRTLRLAPQARLLGVVPEATLAELYNAADCSLVPSLDLECFGLATIEALACGTPVLGSRAGATPEVLGPLGPELLFEPGSVEALAAKLRDVLDGRLSLPTRARCAAYARESFSWDRPVRALEQAFLESCGTNQPR